ncbi:hypothetical protein UFOVP703_44 [uncultured Caudovirales phage]|uniref:Uncharacterized protein n=1 Tax=uncultured Caudovirales phage TaxID=2100421 RepID=A0A6J5NMK9_9CAUD|nr:hypothetical protein UFOVP703_44 [uncultured Caudovirales phage]
MTTEIHEDDIAALRAFEAEQMASLEATAKDEPVLETPLDPNEPPIQPTQAPSPAPAPAPAPTQAPAPAAPVAAPAAPTPPAAPAPQEDKSRGDLRNALRASRHNERQLRERVEQMERDIADMRAGKQPAAASPSTPKDMEAYIAEVELNFPEQGRVLRAQQQQLQELQARMPAAPPPPEPAFIPEQLDPRLQEVVDDVPELLAMQSTKELQEQWTAAKALDAALSTLPAWKDKPLQQRFAEVVKQVKQQFGAPAPAPIDPAAAVQAAVAGAQARPPTTLSDLAGGVAPQDMTPDPRNMTDDAIMAWLDRSANK